MAEYISRDDIFEFADYNRPDESDYFGAGIAERMRLDAIKELCEELDKLPFVEIEEEPIKRGHWEYNFIAPKGADSVKVTAHCSECGCANSINGLYGMGNLSDDKRTPIVWSGFFTNFNGHEERARDFAIDCAKHMKTFDFCPDCGAKMDEEVEQSCAKC